MFWFFLFFICSGKAFFFKVFVLFFFPFFSFLLLLWAFISCILRIVLHVIQTNFFFVCILYFFIWNVSLHFFHKIFSLCRASLSSERSFFMWYSPTWFFLSLFFILLLLSLHFLPKVSARSSSSFFFFLSSVFLF